MDRMKAVVAAAVLAMVIAMVGVLWASSLDPRAGPGQPLLATESPEYGPPDEPLRLSALDGATPQAVHGATPAREPYIVLKLDPSMVAEATLHGFDLPSMTPHPTQDAFLVAYHAKSTHLGCIVDFAPFIPGPGLWLMDPCHQGQWNILDEGAPRPNQPPGGPLQSFEVLLGTGPDPQILVR